MLSASARQREPIVLIPAYEPGQPLLDLVQALLAEGFRVIVVNDGSSLATFGIFQQLPPSVTLLEHLENAGKGRALKTGLEYIARELPGRAVITADADGQHRPEDIVRVAEALRPGARELVLGSRQFEGEIPWKSRFGNTLTRQVYASATGVRVMDTQTGLRGFCGELIPDLLKVRGERYEYELNMLMWAAREGVPIREVPIRTVYIANNAGSHFRPVVDSLRVYTDIVRFAGSSLLAFGVDFGALLALRAVTAGMGPATSLALSAVGARALSASLNFGVNRSLVFRTGGRSAPLAQSAARYFALALGILCANVALLYLLNVQLGLRLWIAKLLTEGILFILSYAVQKTAVFRIRPAVAGTAATRRSDL